MNSLVRRPYKCRHLYGYGLCLHAHTSSCRYNPWRGVKSGSSRYLVKLFWMGIVAYDEATFFEGKHRSPSVHFVNDYERFLAELGFISFRQALFNPQKHAFYAKCCAILTVLRAT